MEALSSNSLEPPAGFQPTTMTHPPFAAVWRSEIISFVTVALTVALVLMTWRLKRMQHQAMARRPGDPNLNDANFWMCAIMTNGLICCGIGLLLGHFFDPKVWSAMVERSLPLQHFDVCNATLAPFNCTSTFCSCTKAWTTTSCSTLEAAHKTGSCTNGHACCVDQDTQESCDDHCFVLSGTCYVWQMVLCYYQNSHNNNNAPKYLRTSLRCALNNSDCVRAVSEGKHIGSHFEARIDPANPHHIFYEDLPLHVPVTQMAFSATLITMGILMGYALFALYKKAIQQPDDEAGEKATLLGNNNT